METITEVTETTEFLAEGVGVLRSFSAPLVLADLSPSVRSAVLAEVLPLGIATVSDVEVESVEYEDGRLVRFTVAVDGP